MHWKTFTNWVAFFLLICSTCPGQQPNNRITNQDVIDMVSLGLSDEVIIEKIHTVTGTEFDTSVQGLRTLKAAKVSDAVIRIMINPSVVGTPGPAKSGATANDRAPLVDDVGVYMVRNGKITEVQPEIVNWQTGGVLKQTATLGIVKGDKNGKVMGGRSPTQTTSPLKFLIKTPEGTSVEEYQLLRVHEKSNRREFRSVTGGVLHVSGGAQRDEVAFQAEKIGNRTWTIVLHNLPSGEYGFLPPGVESASISASGKMYTFGVIEEGHTQAPRDFAETYDSAEISTADLLFQHLKALAEVRLVLHLKVIRQPDMTELSSHELLRADQSIKQVLGQGM